MNISLWPLLIGLILGIALGWLARGARQTASTVERARDITPTLSDDEQQRALEQTLNDSLAHNIAHKVEPLEKALDRLGYQLQELEADRATAFSSLSSQVQAMSRTSTRLSDRTEQLVSALRSPNVRGRWGEIQLERVVELGGMVKHCDFNPQVTGYIGAKQVRPDMVINLAGGRHIIVDAKVPFSSYLDALESPDPEEHAALLRRHAHLLRNHVSSLASKQYIEAFQPTPEFVVLFVPADPFLDAALSVDPELLDFAFEKGVVIATPSSLFALLRTVALGWNQEDLSDKAREVQRLGRELFSRLNTMGEHYNKVGQHLDRAVEAFNQTLSSMDSRVMVTARKLKELDIPIRENDSPTELKLVSNSSRLRHAEGE